MKMKKGLLTMLALLFMGSGAFAQGTLDVPEVARKAGPVKQVVVLESKKEGTVKIRLTGTENYRDLQFDIKLPAGLTVKSSLAQTMWLHLLYRLLKIKLLMLRPFALCFTLPLVQTSAMTSCLRFLSKLQRE